MNKRLFSYPAAVGFLAIATILFLLPGSSFPKQNWFSLFLAKISFDKMVHFAIFFILVSLWVGTINRHSLHRQKRSWMVLAVCILYGILVEIIQHNWIANRSFEWSDILADAIGAITGYIFIVKYIQKKRPL